LRLVVVPLLALMRPLDGPLSTPTTPMSFKPSRDWIETSLDRSLAELMEGCWHIDVLASISSSSMR